MRYIEMFAFGFSQKYKNTTQTMRYIEMIAFGFSQKMQYKNYYTWIFNNKNTRNAINKLSHKFSQKYKKCCTKIITLGFS